MSSPYVCATYFELTNPVVQNIRDKKHFRGHNVLQTSLVLTVMIEIYHIWNHFLQLFAIA